MRIEKGDRIRRTCTNRDNFQGRVIALETVEYNFGGYRSLIVCKIQGGNTVIQLGPCCTLQVFGQTKSKQNYRKLVELQNTLSKI